MSPDRCINTLTDCRTRYFQHMVHFLFLPSCLLVSNYSTVHVWFIFCICTAANQSYILHCHVSPKNLNVRVPVCFGNSIRWRLETLESKCSAIHTETKRQLNTPHLSSFPCLFPSQKISKAPVPHCFHTALTPACHQSERRIWNTYHSPKKTVYSKLKNSL